MDIQTNIYLGHHSPIGNKRNTYDSMKSKTQILATMFVSFLLMFSSISLLIDTKDSEGSSIFDMDESAYLAQKQRNIGYDSIYSYDLGADYKEFTQSKSGHLHAYGFIWTFTATEIFGEYYRPDGCSEIVTIGAELYVNDNTKKATIILDMYGDLGCFYTYMENIPYGVFEISGMDIIFDYIPHSEPSSKGLSPKNVISDIGRAYEGIVWLMGVDLIDLSPGIAKKITNLLEKALIKKSDPRRSDRRHTHIGLDKPGCDRYRDNATANGDRGTG